jgi:DeoR family transcriptional regulator, aga operon transcriptional repressor
VLGEERRRAVIELLNREGRVLVPDLSKRFRISQVTIRKDLEILHEKGQLHRSHGGALPAQDGALEDPTLREKEQLHRKEKLHLAAAADHMVKERQVVILDSGTTTTAIARALRGFKNLTVITNAVNIAAELSATTLDVIRFEETASAAFFTPVHRRAAAPPNTFAAFSRYTRLRLASGRPNPFRLQ